MKTLLITGQINSGKTSFINKYIMINRIEYSGIKTSRIYNGTEFKGFNINLIKNGNIEKSLPLMRINTDYKKVYRESFSKLIAPIFKMIDDEDVKCIIIDELGRFEKEEIEYLKLIEKIVDMNKLSIICLKKEDLHFNNYILNKVNRDIKLIDMDVDGDDIKEKILNSNSNKNNDIVLILSDIDESKLNLKECYKKYILKNTDKNLIDFEKVIKSYKENKYISYIKLISLDNKFLKKASEYGIVSEKFKKHL